jgi:hypothetical protein
VAIILLLVAALFALGYAAWSLTARLGIFADFADGITVTREDAQASDSIDLVLVLFTSGLALLALATWFLAARRASRGTASMVGWILALAGVVVVFAGLALGSSITDAGDQIAQGERGVTACVVTGIGFAVLAVGMLVGATALRPSGRDSQVTSMPRSV